MLTISSNRIIGIISVCFILVSAVGSIITAVQLAYENSLGTNVAIASISSLTSLFSLIGVILFWVAIYGFSRDYQEPKIFNYILYGIIVTIVVAVIAGVALLAYMATNMSNIISALNPSPSQAEISSSISPYLSQFMTVFGFVGLIYIVFELLAFNLLSKKTGVPLFKTGIRLLLLGGIFTIVIGIIMAAVAGGDIVANLRNFSIIALPGSIIQYIGWALVAIAFFRVKPPQETYNTYYAPPAPMTHQAKVCPNCGSQNLHDSRYCSRCGQKLT